MICKAAGNICGLTITEGSGLMVGVVAAVGVSLEKGIL